MKVFMLIFSLLFVGCSIEDQSYLYLKATDWQNREVEKEEIVDGHTPTLDELYEVTNDFYMYYDDDENDHWKTSKEFKDDGKRGDCEDIALFLLVTLRDKLEISDNNIWCIVYERRKDKYHATLSVRTTSGWRYYDHINWNYGIWSYRNIDPMIEFNLFDIKEH